MNPQTTAAPGTVVPSGVQVSPAGQPGPGQYFVSQDAGNLAILGSDNLISVPTSNVTAIRLRSFNAVGNPNFEVDQRNVGNAITANGFIQDRWSLFKAGTMAVTGQKVNPTSGNQALVPGTNFIISNSILRIQLSTAQASLGTGDSLQVSQAIEGPLLRELIGDVHSISLLVRTSVAGLKFSLALKDTPTVTTSLVKLCTVPTANVWTLIPLPNLPLMPVGGNFSSLPGAMGYQLIICLAAGTSQIAPVTDTWQSGNFPGAPGMSNFAASAVNSTFDIGFVQHEPGSVCTQLQDKPFTQNYDECLRYYAKSYAYGTKAGTVASAGAVTVTVTPNAHAIGHVPFKKTMAKTPTVSIYSSQTGTANAVYDAAAATDRGIAGVYVPGESGFGGATLNSFNAAAAWYVYNYTADTGW